MKPTPDQSMTEAGTKRECIFDIEADHGSFRSCTVEVKKMAKILSCFEKLLKMCGFNSAIPPLFKMKLPAAGEEALTFLMSVA